MKRILLVLPFLILADAALAAPSAPAAASPTTVPYASLPVGEVSRPPPASKRQRPSGSRAEGFYVKREGHNYVTIRGEKPPAQNPSFGFARNQASSACLSSSSDSFAFGAQTEQPSWSLQSEAVMSAGMQPGTLTLHREEVSIEDGRASLDTRDAVVDVRSLASKSIDRRSLALGKVADLVAGVQVYALRSRETVEFVILVPPEVLSPHGMMMGKVSGVSQMITSSQCRHIRVSTAVKKGDGTASTVLFSVIDNDGRASVADGMETRTLRTLAVHVSTSWLSGDADPLVSASAGWQGSSERQRLPAGMR